MKRISVMSLALVCILLAHGLAHGFSCRGGFVSVGAMQEEVLRKCGEPQDVQTWVEDALNEQFLPGNLSGNIYLVPRVVQIRFERWNYNLGPNRFMPSFVFREGVLIRIIQGGYGR